MKAWKEMTDAAREPARKMNQTLIEVVGTGRVLIEHHRGILCYGTAEIIAGASFGRVHILGENLRLCCMSREQLFIAGRIQGIELEREGC